MITHQQVRVGQVDFHVVDNGVKSDSTLMFLHGWPEDWSSWQEVVNQAHGSVRAVMLDLPGIGKSVCQKSPITKAEIADSVHDLSIKLQLKGVTIIGHDVGGQVTFAYLVRHSARLARAVIMNVVVPGVDPWDEVERNPYIWHFRFHSIRELPELLVAGKQRQYFDYFYNVISKHPERISAQARDGYARAYGSKESLAVGFDWYRAFPQDMKDNREITGNRTQINTPLLYIRGEAERGDIDAYVKGFKNAGIQYVEGAIVGDSGHFSAEENPKGVWEQIEAFVNGKTMAT